MATNNQITKITNKRFNFEMENFANTMESVRQNDVKETRATQNDVSTSITVAEIEAEYKAELVNKWKFAILLESQK